MPSPSIIPRYFSPTRDSSSFDHFSSPDSDQMIFGPIDIEDIPPYRQWDPYTDLDTDPKPAYNFTPIIPMTNYEYGPQLSPTDSHSGSFYSTDGIKSPEDNNLYLSHWINDPELSPSSPIPIPSPSDTQPSSSSSFVAYGEHVHFPADGTFSPASFAALHPLPGSMSPSSSFEDLRPSRNIVDSVSPRDTALHTPSWASQLWESVPSSLRSPSHVRPSVRHSPMTDGTTVRQRTVSLRRGSLSAGQIFQSSSAPAMTDPHASSMNRSYSRRSESASVADDRDATVRRKKRSPPTEDIPAGEKPSDSTLKSVLRPPKLAPSAWQLYFTDWIQRQQASGTRKLNVAQAAKEAGQEYACLSAAEKEPYKRRSQAAKEARERELNAYMRTLTPDDIKRENAFRAAQRKAGKSRKSNIKDPNAPKKPLSAYFMFLQRIRANPQLVQEIFGEETETTKQSVLAAAKWRSMTDGERQPFLAQAEQEKMEYEAARRLYEEGTTGFNSSINFSILPGSPAFPTVKIESESDENDELTWSHGEQDPGR
ncbi:hypothetical protein K443DRAFT_675725 [Laccaria amethystina LaAM-08-1]|uniref:HMG box domain-containing protein n=1 Tax=Laccaria amethystina LaAM-08-1 TaxID=1095629 RepID=A0A0C9XI81_9AGAR|nr:hypothetical protein K443DRAFT_675725 [Laccaria amethystina LaAM-08-1]